MPIEHQLSTSTVSRHVHQIAERLEGELGDEQPSFIEGCPDQWYKLPEPAAPLTVSLDGGYVHARSKTQRNDGSFEVIVGKAPQEKEPPPGLGWSLATISSRGDDCLKSCRLRGCK